MSQTKPPFFEALSQHPSRLKSAVDDLNFVASAPELGASFDQIKQVHHVLQTNAGQTGKEEDLVQRLIDDPENKDLWSAQLLGNQFCADMGNTKKSSPNYNKVLKGFKAYMLQDYIYMARSMSYQNERTQQATSIADFDDNAKRTGRYGDYTSESLHLCVDPEPKGLCMTAAETLPASSHDIKALDDYTKFQSQTAEEQDWVMSFVAMIPCFQSYAQIAATLKTANVDTTTAWYNIWILPNSDPDSADKQRAFFVANYNQWKDRYPLAKSIFQTACKGEIDLWAYAKQQETV